MAPSGTHYLRSSMQNLRKYWGFSEINKIKPGFYWCLAPALVFFLFVLSANKDSLQSPCLSNMDRAYSHLAVESALRGEAYDGAFSHAGFRHPGPIFYYYLAGARQILDSLLPLKGIYHLATLFLNCVFLSIAVYLLGSLNSIGIFALFLYPISLAVFQVSTFTDYWNPYPICSATLVFLLALTHFALGKVNFLPIICVIGSFIAQGHVGTLPFLGATFLYAASGFFYSRRGQMEKQQEGKKTGEPQLRYLIFSLLLLFILWAPVIIDVFRFGANSNPAAICGSFLEEHPARSISSTANFVWDLAAKKTSYLSALVSDFGGPQFSEFFPALLIATLLALLFCRSRPLFHLSMLLIISTAITVLALLKNFRPNADYLVSYFYAVVSLALFFLFYQTFKFSGRFSGPLRLGACSFLGFFLLLSSFSSLNLEIPKSKCDRIEFAQKFIEALKPQKGVRYVLEPENFKVRLFVAFFSIELLKNDLDFCITDAWTHYLGKSFTCSYRRAFYPKLKEIPIYIKLENRNSDKISAEGHRRAITISWPSQLRSQLPSMAEDGKENLESFSAL